MLQVVPVGFFTSAAMKGPQVSRRQCGQVVMALVLRSGDLGSRPAQWPLAEFDPGSLWFANWFASGQLGFLPVVVVVVVILFRCFVVFHWP